MDPKFTFPFQPYPIQEKFMRELYFTIEGGKLGIFESPTGTGKSLSISCGSLQWLKDSEQKTIKGLEDDIASLKLSTASDSIKDDWLQEEYEKIKKTRELLALQSKLDKIKKHRERFQELKLKVAKSKTNSTGKTIQCYFQKVEKNRKDTLLEEKENVPDECEMEEDKDLILEECEQKEESDDEEALREEPDNVTKVYISSRTHSQLSQFVGEIKRTIFKDNVRLVTLASRQHYCINSEVTKLKNINMINERCLDLQKSKSMSTAVGDDGKVVKRSKTKLCSACPYYNQSNITQLKERILVDILDMEDLVNCGKELKGCPYYASRMALNDAEVVLVSHAGVVSAGARRGASLALRDHVLIVDEAHALPGALESAHAAPVSAQQLRAVRTHVQRYVNKYRARLSSNSLLLLNQLIFVVTRLLGILNPKSAEGGQENTTIFTLEDFVIKAEIDHLNLRPLVEFCRSSRLAPKLHGFSARYGQQALEEDTKTSTVNKKSAFESFLKNISKKISDDVEDQKPDSELDVQHPVEPSPASALYAALEFLERLCARSADGRVLARAGASGALLKYILLNPGQHFADVVKQCRSVIVAGGTMEPISEFQSLLTAHGSAASREVRVVRCAHVVPPENVLAVCVRAGPAGRHLNFAFHNRNSSELLFVSEYTPRACSSCGSCGLDTTSWAISAYMPGSEMKMVCGRMPVGWDVDKSIPKKFVDEAGGHTLNEVGRILSNVCSIVPGGIVCFLPSYSFEETVFEQLTSSKVIETISRKKSVFREPKSAADVDQVLSKFATAARGGGALLLSVVGGKLSEGLNFSDELGRCVMVVGMPYPNVASPELREKVAYLERAGSSGSAYCDTLCMKAVNQCIGRAVRHANDYACVLLVDERYSRPRTVAALPPFVQASLMPNCNFGQTVASIAKFFAKHKQKQSVNK